MEHLRSLIARHRHVAALLFAAALLLKLAVPTGYMLENQDGRITIGVCSGTGGQTMVIEIPGLADKAPVDDTHRADAMPCAYAAIAAPFLGAVDPFLLLAALALVAASALATPSATPRAQPPRLRPPLRGPPLAL